MSDDREPVECCKCHQSMSLDDGCEWGDFERLYCWGCAHDKIERLQAIVDRLLQGIDFAAQKLLCVELERSIREVPEIVKACDRQALQILREAAEKARGA